MNYLYYAFNQRAKAREPINNKVSNYIYREDLSKKNTKLQSNTTKLKREMEEVSLLQREEYYSEKKFKFDKKDHKGLQVKILMTKEEATRLLSKCKNGGVLEFNDLARELERIPVDRVSLGNSSALERIPEEF